MFQTDRNWLRSPVERVGSLADAALPPPQDMLDDDVLVVRALQERDERAFELLLDRYYSPMLRLAWTYVRSQDEAEEVIQDTWLAVLSGIDRFEGRSSLKTWIFRILVNRARTRAKREARSVPLSSLQRHSTEAAEEDHALDPLHITIAQQGDLAFGAALSSDFQPPDEQFLATELRDQLDAAVRSLPQRQQDVISLRDVHGWSAQEVCELLGISDANQRILLHRARVRVRELLSGYLGSSGPGDSGLALVPG